jgi:uncharacterized membrane protein
LLHFEYSVHSAGARHIKVPIGQNAQILSSLLALETTLLSAVLRLSFPLHSYCIWWFWVLGIGYVGYIKYVLCKDRKQRESKVKERKK